MHYQEAIDFLFPLHRFGIRPGLERIAVLLEELDCPQQRLGTVVHIAGTNGKGTVAACMASIFQAAGYRTGLYTSPHLVDFTERIRIDGRKIPQSAVASYCSRIAPAVIREKATFFEATTAMAFAYFASEHVDVSVIETGMGGRLDATNMVNAGFVVIPSIGRDHTAWLGESLDTIAREKAAIIKSGSRVYTGVRDPAALDQIRSAADGCGAPLFIAGKDAACRVAGAALGRIDLEVLVPPGRPRCYQVPLTGSFHAVNVTLAVMVALAAGIREEDIARGLSGLASTGYRARLEQIAVRPAVLLDVSHNPDGMEKSVQAIRETAGGYRSLVVLIGLASDKDALHVVLPLAELAGRFVTVNLPSERGLPSERLGAVCAEAGAAEVVVCDAVADGLEKARSMAGPEDMILVTGSFYLAGEVIRLVEPEPGDGESRCT